MTGFHPKLKFRVTVLVARGCCTQLLLTIVLIIHTETDPDVEPSRLTRKISISTRNLGFYFFVFLSETTHIFPIKAFAFFDVKINFFF